MSHTTDTGDLFFKIKCIFLSYDDENEKKTTKRREKDTHAHTLQ